MPLNTSITKVLVIEDHDDLREATISALTAMGHRVEGVGCAEEADEMFPTFNPDLLLLDLGLPGEDGLSLARRIRQAQPGIGIIMVTARGSATDTRKGYNDGADIYIPKPTTPEELDAAIRALARRLHPSAPSSILLDGHSLLLKNGSAEVDLSYTDYQILSALLRARDCRLETWQILEILGKEADEPEKKALTVHIVRLRKKLNEANLPEPTIKAIRGSGYQLCVNMELT